MLIIWFILSFPLILADTISDFREFKGDPFRIEVSESIYITSEGKLHFKEKEYIRLTGAFDNQGEFLGTTKQSGKGLTVLHINTKAVFKNTGTYTVEANSDNKNHFEINFQKFINSGTLVLDSLSSAGTYMKILGTKNWENHGTIIARDGSSNRGTIQMSSEESGVLLPIHHPITNNGIIKLYNLYYAQPASNIYGVGCIVLEQNSYLRLNSWYTSNDQNFVMGIDSTISVGFSSIFRQYNIINFGRGNKIGLDSSLYTPTYDSKKGLLTLMSFSGSTKYFFIGPGYRENKFKLEGSYVTYIDDPPNISDSCKEFSDGNGDSPTVDSNETKEGEAIDLSEVGLYVCNENGDNKCPEVPAGGSGSGGNNEVEVPGTVGGGGRNENELGLPSIGGGYDKEVEVSGGTVAGGGENNKVPSPGGSNENEVELVGTIEGSSGNGNKEEENPGGIDEGGNKEEEVPGDYSEVELPGIAEGGGNSDSNEMELPSIIEGGEGSNKNEVEVPGNDVENGGGNEKNEVESTAGITEGGADKEKEVPDIAEGGNGNKEEENPGGIDEGGNKEEEVPGDYSEVELPGIAEGGGNSDSNEMELPSIIESGEGSNKNEAEVPDIVQANSDGNENEVEAPGDNVENGDGSDKSEVENPGGIDEGGVDKEVQIPGNVEGGSINENELEVVGIIGGGSDADGNKANISDGSNSDLNELEAPPSTEEAGSNNNVNEVEIPGSSIEGVGDIELELPSIVEGGGDKEVEVPGIIEAGGNSDKVEVTSGGSASGDENDVEVPGTDGGGSSNENELEPPSIVEGENDGEKNEVEVVGGTVVGGSGSGKEEEVPSIVEGGNGDEKEVEVPDGGSGGIGDNNEIEIPGIPEGGNDSDDTNLNIPGGSTSDTNELEVPGGQSGSDGNKGEIENTGIVEGGYDGKDVESTVDITEGGADKEKEVPDIAEGGNGNKEVENPGGIAEGSDKEEEVPVDYNEVELPGIAEGGGNSGSNEMELPSIIEGGEGSNKNEVEVPGNDVENGGGNEKNEVESTAGITEGGVDKEREVTDSGEGGNGNKEVENPGGIDEGGNKEEEVPGDYSEVELPGIAEGGGNSDSNEVELPDIIGGGADKEKGVPDIAEGGSNDKEVETPGSTSEGSSNEINNGDDSKDQVDGSGSNEIKDGITETNGSDRDDGSKSGPQPDGSGSNGTEEGENVSNGDNSGDSSNNDPSSEFNGIPPESNSGSTHVPDGAKGSTSEGNYGGDVLGNGSIDDSDEKKLAETNNGSDGIRETSNETNDKDSNSESKNETPPESNGSIPGSTPGSNSGVSDGMNESNGVNTDGFTDGTPSGPDGEGGNESNGEGTESEYDNKDILGSNGIQTGGNDASLGSINGSQIEEGENNDQDIGNGVNGKDPNGNGDENISNNGAQLESNGHNSIQEGVGNTNENGLGGSSSNVEPEGSVPNVENKEEHEGHLQVPVIEENTNPESVPGNTGASPNQEGEEGESQVNGEGSEHEFSGSNTGSNTGEDVNKEVNGTGGNDKDTNVGSTIGGNVDIIDKGDKTEGEAVYIVQGEIYVWDENENGDDKNSGAITDGTEKPMNQVDGEGELVDDKGGVGNSSSDTDNYEKGDTGDSEHKEGTGVANITGGNNKDTAVISENGNEEISIPGDENKVEIPVGTVEGSVQNGNHVEQSGNPENGDISDNSANEEVAISGGPLEGTATEIDSTDKYDSGNELKVPSSENEGKDQLNSDGEIITAEGDKKNQSAKPTVQEETNQVNPVKESNSEQLPAMISPSNILQNTEEKTELSFIEQGSFVDPSKPFKLFVENNQIDLYFALSKDGIIVVDEHKYSLFEIQAGGELTADGEYIRVLESGKMIATSESRLATRVWSIVQGKLDLSKPTMKRGFVEFTVCDQVVYVNGIGQGCKNVEVLFENSNEDYKSLSEVQIDSKETGEAQIGIANSTAIETGNESTQYMTESVIAIVIETGTVTVVTTEETIYQSGVTIVSSNDSPVNTIEEFDDLQSTDLGNPSDTITQILIEGGINKTVTTDAKIKSQSDEFHISSTVESISKTTGDSYNTISNRKSIPTMMSANCAQDGCKEYTKVVDIGIYDSTTVVTNPSVNSNPGAGQLYITEFENGSNNSIFIDIFAALAMFIPFLWI
ncbi:uncharacterized protein SPAPADRAFT_52353 [Spathaspora passalidarum NRRL Y-27907]|uniref:Hyphally-regulated cell wall protein N-terminal domain-containing protein n=1 Tax=Spathaspora passalidarum (strain NRRL Y-27907 / 11-Y1) TaxID=619300 RepID=G3AUG3_SPAPN|nr:uncharacterized protein SPAPADRAFT_52353 [Spathaspora passalidarum NRRL Y-27907]EGW30249.1 hypothetical protein SPAPADRAFT_52353 [Spathaspora passalidarum NRRL Y-27907]